MTTTTPAGFWRRYVAYSLDFCVLGSLATLLTRKRVLASLQHASSAMTQLSDTLGQRLADALLQGTTPTALSTTLLRDPHIQATAAAVQSGLVDAVLAWLWVYAPLAALWHVGFERSRWLGSPGKHALGLRVVGMADDTLPSPLQTVVRHVAGALSWLSFNLGHALAALPPQKRALHDYIAATRVVVDDTPRLPGWAKVWLVLQLVAGVMLTGWLLQRYVAALQASLT